MKAKILVVMVCVMAVVNFASVVSAETSTQLFFDDFTGTALDTSLWSVFVDINGDYHTPYVAGGLLHSQGYHTRIDSIDTFAAPEAGQSVMARARIRLAGSVHKFGFAVNPNEHVGPINGYYFDTYHLDTTVPPESQGREHYVRVVAWSYPGSGSMINLLNVEIPVTWYEFHEFAIERTPSEVIFSIDGQEVARVADVFGGALPVGVWNDRWDMMQTDWVEVCRSEPSSIEAAIDIDPDTLNLQSKGKWITCYIELAEDYDVDDIDIGTILLNDQVPAESHPTGIGDCDDDGVPDLMVKFDRSAVQQILQPGDDVEITVTGELNNGTQFEGSDTIRVIDKGKGKGKK